MSKDVVRQTRESNRIRIPNQFLTNGDYVLQEKRPNEIATSSALPAIPSFIASEIQSVVCHASSIGVTASIDAFVSSESTCFTSAAAVENTTSAVRGKKFRSQHQSASSSSSKKFRSCHVDASAKSSIHFRTIHPEASRKSSSEFRVLHPDASKSSSSKFRDLHPDASKSSSSEYRKANPDASAESSKERRKKLKGMSKRQLMGYTNNLYDRDVIHALRHKFDLDGAGRDMVCNLSDEIHLDDVVTRARLAKTMGDQVMSNEKLQDVLSTATKTYNSTIPLKCCACCGVRDIDEKLGDKFIELHLTDEIASRLRVDQPILDIWNQKQARAALVPPIVLGPRDALVPPPSVSVVDIVKQAFNYVELPRDSSHWYHLHRCLLIQFDDRCSRDAIKFLACRSCAAGLSSKARSANGEFAPPRFSLKSGMDMGNLTALTALGMPSLSVPELQILSPTRIMSVILKLVADGNAESQFGLRGHVVVFPHKSIESLQSAGVFPNWSAVDSEFSYAFIGKKDEWQRLRDGNKLPKSQIFRVEVWRLLAWARALSHINNLPAFKNIEPDFDAETEARLVALPDQLISQVSILDNPVTLGIDLKKSSDVAQVRNREEETIPSEATAATASNLQTKLHHGDDTVLLDAVMLQNSGEVQRSHAFTGVSRAVSSIIDTISGTAGNAGCSIGAIAKQARSAAGHPNVANVPGSVAGLVNAVDTSMADVSAEASNASADTANLTAEAPEKTRIIRRGKEPMSEFGDNHLLLGNSFPLLWLTGVSGNIIPHSGSMSKPFVKFLLNQFDSRWARNQQWLFLSYNQYCRHSNISSVTARVRSGHEFVEKFQKLMAQPNIVADLKQAADQPKTDESRKLMNKIMPVIKLAGQKTDWGPIARAVCVSKITAMTQTYGPANYFCTLSPDDTNNQLTLRFSRKRKSDEGPVDEEIADVPLLIDRQKYLAMNPLAAARMFQTIVEHVFEKLFGMTLAHKKKSTGLPPGKRPQGALGNCYDAFIIFETQGRGSLHFHAIIWAGIPCQTFSIIAEDTELSKIAAEAIDKTVCASLEPKYHDAADKTGVARRRARMGGRALASDPLLPVYKVPVTGCPSGWDEFLVHAHSVAASAQIHWKHFKTCQNGKIGKRQCRMAQPQPLREDATGPVQIKYTVEAAASKGAKKQWSFDLFKTVEPAPRRTRDVGGKIPFRSNPGYLVDNRAIEFAMKRPSMLLPGDPEDQPSDKRNKDVVIHSTLMSGIYGSNNNLSALTAANGAKAISFYLVGYLSKDKCALAATASLMYEALLHSRKYPSEAPDIGNIKRSNVHILHRTLNSIAGKNEEMSATMAAFCLLDMPSSMSSRKFWFAFVRPALAMQKKLFPHESVRPPKDASKVKSIKSMTDGNEDTDSESDDDHALDETGTDKNSTISTDSDGSAGMDESGSPPTFVPEREDFVINFSSVEELGDDHDGSSEIIRKKDGKLAVVEQHEHYKYRGPGMREMNLDEYVSLVTIVPKRNEAAAVDNSDDKKSDEAMPDGVVDDDGGSDEDEMETEADDKPRRRFKVRTRNGTFPFAAEHPLADSHEQRLRSDPRIVQVGGRAIPCFPGPMVADSSSWQRDAQAFAEFIVVFLCPWNPTTFHPERFDEATGEYVDVPLNWNGMCDWIEILYNRAAALQKTADQNCVLETDPIEKVTKVVSLQEVEDPKIWLSGRLFRFRNLASGLRTTVGLRNANVWFRHQASTKWNNSTKNLIDPSEADLCGAIVEHVDHEADEQNAREVDEAIKWLDDRVASMHDNSDSAASKQKRAHNATIDILQNLCASEVVVPRSVSADSIVMAEADLRRITQKLEKPNENPTEEVSMDSDDEAGNGPMPVDDVLPPSSSSAECTDEQAAALKVVMDWLRLQLQHEAGGHSTKVPAVPKLLIHGPGGSGKSFFAAKLVEEVRKLTGTDSSIRGCAPTGVAAINLGFESVTYQHLLKMSGKRGRGKGAMNTGTLRQLQQHDLKGLRILILDEISFVSATSLYEIHCRLCEIFTPGDQSIAFGGIAIVVMGDFFQLAPIYSDDLVSEMYARARKNFHLELPGIDDHERGLELFLQFRKIEFVAQNRSTDPDHTAFLNHMRANPDEPIGAEQIEILRKKILTREDYEQDPELFDAPIIVTNNKLRESLNLHMAKEFGKRHGVPVLRWRVKVTGKGARACTEEELEMIAGHFDCLFAIFVLGGPCYLTNNINPAKGLANGTAAIMRRLVFATREEHDECHAQIAAAAPGEVVDLMFDPVAVIVNVPSMSPAAYPDESLQNINGLSDEDKSAGFVIPVMPSKYAEKLKIGDDSTRTEWNYYEPGFELGFSITFHKVQGKTLSRLILCLNPEVYSLSNVTFRGLYVGLSRVRNGNHVKIFPPLMSESLSAPFTNLLNLRASDNLINGLRAYDANGVWAEPDFSKANQAKTKTKAKTSKKRKSADASKHTQPKSKAAKPKTGAISGTKAPAINIDTNVIVIDDGSKAIVKPAVMDADMRAGIAANLLDHLPGTKPDANQVAAQAALASDQAVIEARIEKRKAEWKKKLDTAITAARANLAKLVATGAMHPLRPHQRMMITAEQSAVFWALPGVELTLRHLRYEGDDAQNGLFDTLRWSQAGVMFNTCPFDSSILAAHILLCTDAVMLQLLKQRAGDGTASDKTRSAARALLEMHRFANVRMWDEARLVIVHHAIFVGNFYTNSASQSRCFDGNELNLTASPEYVDGLFTSAGLSIGAFERVTTTTCDNVDCPLYEVSAIKVNKTAAVIMPKPSAAHPTFEAGLQQLNSTVQAGLCGHRISEHERPCTGNATTTLRVRGSLPRLLAAGVEDAAFIFRASDFPSRLTLQEYHDGIDAQPRNVQYALNTLLHYTGDHFTAHGFLANDENQPYPFFHDAARRPMATPAQLDQNGVIVYNYKVFRAWYTRVGVV